MSKAHLEDTSTITGAERTILAALETKRLARDARASEQIWLYGGVNATAWRQAFDERSRRIARAGQRLSEGVITWGQFNAARQQAQEAFAADMKRIGGRP